MIFRLLSRRSPDRATIAALYGAIVAQARHETFYLHYAVPDTVAGRFDMVVLHLWLVLRRLQTSAAGRTLAQGVFDHFCRDMDHSFREMGVGDLAVPRRMREVGEAFYGRAGAYDAALDGPDSDALASALARNIYASLPRGFAGARRLADYVRSAAADLAAQDETALTQGQPRFPQPDWISAD